MHDQIPALDVNVEGSIALDAEQNFVRRIATMLPGIDGSPARPITELARLVRAERIVILTLPTTGPLGGDVLAEILPDVEAAEVDYANKLDELRRDGWTEA